jgi:hypothetical protein
LPGDEGSHCAQNSQIAAEDVKVVKGQYFAFIAADCLASRLKRQLQARSSEMLLGYHDIAPYAPFLRMNQVQLADVLLSRASGKKIETKLIAKMTQGVYSHAAVFISFKEGADGKPTMLQLVEAEDLGVGWTSLDPFPLALDGDRFEDVAAPPGNPAKAALFRHPQIAKVPLQRLIEASRRIRDEQLFMAYPPLVRLVDATAFPSFMKTVVRRAAAREKYKHDPLAIGSFCSQLVAQFYELLPIGLFDAPRPANEVSPNALAASNLVEVRDAVILSETITKQAVANVSDPREVIHTDALRKGWLPYIAAFKAFGKLAGIKVPILLNEARIQHARRFNAFYGETRAGIKQELAKLPQQVDTAFRAGNAEDLERSGRADEMQDTILYLVAMDRVLDQEDEKPDPGDRGRSILLQFLNLQAFILTELNLELVELWIDTTPPEIRSPEFQAELAEFEKHLPGNVQQLKEIGAGIPGQIAELGARHEIDVLVKATTTELEKIRQGG